MTDDKQPREFWIDYERNCVLKEEPFGTSSNYFIKVIEHSAYAKLKEENERLKSEYNEILEPIFKKKMDTLCDENKMLRELFKECRDLIKHLDVDLELIASNSEHKFSASRKMMAAMLAKLTEEMK